MKRSGVIAHQDPVLASIELNVTASTKRRCLRSRGIERFHDLLNGDFHITMSRTTLLDMISPVISK